MYFKPFFWDFIRANLIMRGMIVFLIAIFAFPGQVLCTDETCGEGYHWGCWNESTGGCSEYSTVCETDSWGKDICRTSCSQQSTARECGCVRDLSEDEQIMQVVLWATVIGVVVYVLGYGWAWK